LTKKYIYGPGIDEPVCIVASGGIWYYHFDGLGSVAALTDSGGTLAERLIAGQDRPTMESIKTLAVSRIKAGKLAEATAATEKLLKDYPMDEAGAMAVVKVATALRKSGQMDTAMGLYNTVLSLKPAEEIQMRCIAGIAQTYVRLGDDAKVQEKVDYLLSNFKDNPDSLAFRVFEIGEEYLSVAEEASNDDAKRQAYQKAIDIGRKCLSANNKLSPSPQFYYFTGYALYQLGKYDEAVLYCEQAVGQWPSYEKAWQCLLMASTCYEKLAQDGSVSQEEANNSIRNCYKRILEKYPTCPSPIKQNMDDWLKQHPETISLSPNGKDYEVLNPSGWVGKNLPVLASIDIQEQLKDGNWLLLFYHFDCPACLDAIKTIQGQEKELLTAGQRIALIEVPPYGKLSMDIKSPCVWGKLPGTKQWLVETPVVVKIRDGIVILCDKNV
jgi:tetratricopeptide (TPR) repeat protein